MGSGMSQRVFLVGRSRKNPTAVAPSTSLAAAQRRQRPSRAQRAAASQQRASHRATPVGERPLRPRQSGTRPFNGSSMNRIGLGAFAGNAFRPRAGATPAAVAATTGWVSKRRVAGIGEFAQQERAVLRRHRPGNSGFGADRRFDSDALYADRRSSAVAARGDTTAEAKAARARKVSDEAGRGLAGWWSRSDSRPDDNAGRRDTGQQDPGELSSGRHSADRHSADRHSADAAQRRQRGGRARTGRARTGTARTGQAPGNARFRHAPNRFLRRGMCRRCTPRLNPFAGWSSRTAAQVTGTTGRTAGRPSPGRRPRRTSRSRPTRPAIAARGTVTAVRHATTEASHASVAVPRKRAGPAIGSHAVGTVSAGSSGGRCSASRCW